MNSIGNLNTTVHNVSNSTDLDRSDVLATSKAIYTLNHEIGDKVKKIVEKHTIVSTGTQKIGPFPETPLPTSKVFVAGVLQYDYTLDGNSIDFGEIVPTGYNVTLLI